LELKEKLVVLRKENGLSQLKLAEMMNVSRQAVSRWEVGKAVPSIDNLKYLGELYEIPVDAFLNENIEIPLPERECNADRTVPQDTKRKRIRGAVAIIFFLLVFLMVVFFMGGSNEDSVPIEEMENIPWGFSDSEEFGVDW
jgi:transcriptional regulator with XRE-family HTH domain